MRLWAAAAEKGKDLPTVRENRLENAPSLCSSHRGPNEDVAVLKEVLEGKNMVAGI